MTASEPVTATEPAASLGDHAFVSLQKRLPTRLITTLMHRLAQARSPWLRRPLIRWFAQRYRINLDEAAEADLDAYASFAEFFARPLKPGLRPMPEVANALASPVDGCISQCGTLHTGRLVQAKGIDYSAAALLGDSCVAEEFRDGSFATIYLSPRDYHRVHMPAGGQLRRWSYVPGRLFSVNPATVRALPGVFTRNERLCAIFDTAYGPLAVILVGALCVGGLETVWSGVVTPPHRSSGGVIHYASDKSWALERGAELGRFNFGSTVILLLARGAAAWSAALRPGQTVRLGQPLATLQPLSSPTPA